MNKIVDMCPDCYGTHYTDAEKQRCAQAQRQQDARLFGPAAMKRYADTCKWCGCVHASPAERAQCMLDNVG
jgi:hypothetical protein